MKGISPLVAVVLLIAVTMSIAGILAFWVSQFARERIAEFEEEAGLAECKFADFSVFRCAYSSETNEIKLLLQNPSRIDLRNLTAFVIYQNDSVLPEEGYMLGELLSNRIKSFTLAGVSSDYSEILITSECPGVEVTTTC